MDTPFEKPRLHHDLFAHLALPRTFLRDPVPIMGILASNDGGAFLRGMWQVIAEELDDDQRLEDGGLSLEHYALEHELFVAVVTMPPAIRLREALFVGLVARFEPSAVARCVTLELVGSAGPDPATVLCEWTADGSPRVLDERGCSPTPAEFVDTIERTLTAKPR